jgi:hypothetical protein
MSLMSQLFGGDPFDHPQAGIDWLLAPGTDRRHVALPLMADALKAAGYTVIHGEMNDVAADHLRAHGWVVHRNFLQAQQAAVRSLRDLGFKIFAPPASPIVGLLWHPKRGASSDRLVAPCDIEGHVAYRNMADGTDHVVTERAWHRWRTEARARVV